MLVGQRASVNALYYPPSPRPSASFSIVPYHQQLVPLVATSPTTRHCQTGYCQRACCCCCHRNTPSSPINHVIYIHGQQLCIGRCTARVLTAGLCQHSTKRTLKFAGTVWLALAVSRQLCCMTINTSLDGSSSRVGCRRW